jgi:hypothetical protein
MLTDPTFAAEGRFYKGNLHCHSTESDGRLPPEEVCAFYRRAGYDFLALTDHFLPKYDFPVTDTRPYRTPEFTTLLRAEVHTRTTELGEMWHILAVGLPEDFEPTRAGEMGPELAARCRQAGAYVVIVHPGWYGLTAADANSIPDAHGIEIYNHTSQIRTDRGDGAYLIDQLLVQGRRVNLCATDDAHFHCDDALGAWVMVKAEANEPALLVESLKTGRFYSTQGPSIESVSIDDEYLHVRCSPARSIIALGRGSLAQQEVGVDLTEARLPIALLRRGGFTRLVVADSQGRRAWTNPYWL